MACVPLVCISLATPMMPSGEAWCLQVGALFTRARRRRILRSSAFKHDVQAEGGRPGEQVGSMTEAGRGIVVLVEALVRAQREDGLSQAPGLLFVAVALQASH